jgi:hypothetical protein
MTKNNVRFVASEANQFGNYGLRFDRHRIAWERAQQVLAEIVVIVVTHREPGICRTLSELFLNVSASFSVAG